MTIRFVEDGMPHGYSMKRGEVLQFPDEIAELIILTGLAVRHTPIQRSVINHAVEALNKARERDDRQG
jgi:hypothetical protein